MLGGVFRSIGRGFGSMMEHGHKYVAYTTAVSHIHAPRTKM